MKEEMKKYSKLEEKRNEDFRDINTTVFWSKITGKGACSLLNKEQNGSNYQNLLKEYERRFEPWKMWVRFTRYTGACKDMWRIGRGAHRTRSGLTTVHSWVLHLDPQREGKEDPVELTLEPDPGQQYRRLLERASGHSAWS